ncbi:hypothetical protein BH09CHL1_BH09CHL1_19980 [soil metagenome]
MQREETWNKQVEYGLLIFNATEILLLCVWLPKRLTAVE